MKCVAKMLTIFCVNEIHVAIFNGYPNEVLILCKYHLTKKELFPLNGINATGISSLQMRKQA